MPIFLSGPSCCGRLARRTSAVGGIVAGRHQFAQHGEGQRGGFVWWPGYSALPLPSALATLGALESVRRELLIVSADVGQGDLNGIALARMVRMKRPDIKLL